MLTLMFLPIQQGAELVLLCVLFLFPVCLESICLLSLAEGTDWSRREKNKLKPNSLTPDLLRESPSPIKRSHCTCPSLGAPMSQ